MSKEKILIGERRYTILFPDLLRALTSEEDRGLRLSIRDRGVVSPIVIEEHGGVIDGANRLRIAAYYKLTEVPFVVRAGLSHEQKRDLALSLNVARRHLTSAEKRAAIQAAVKAAPQKSNNRLAAETGASDKTVTSVRTDLERRSEIPNIGARTDTAGRTQPANKPRLRPVQDEGPDKAAGTRGETKAPGDTGANGASPPVAAPAQQPERTAAPERRPAPEPRPAVITVKEPQPRPSQIVNAAVGPVPSPPAPTTPPRERSVLDQAKQAYRLLSADERKAFALWISTGAE